MHTVSLVMMMTFHLVSVVASMITNCISLYGIISLHITNTSCDDFSYIYFSTDSFYMFFVVCRTHLFAYGSFSNHSKNYSLNYEDNMTKIIVNNVRKTNETFIDIFKGIPLHSQKERCFKGSSEISRVRTGTFCNLNKAAGSPIFTQLWKGLKISFSCEDLHPWRTLNDSSSLHVPVSSLVETL